MTKSELKQSAARVARGDLVDGEPSRTDRIVLAVLSVGLLVSVLALAFVGGGCESAPPVVESVTWTGEAGVGVDLDVGHVRSGVEYHGLAVEDETIHCPVLYLDVLVETGIGTIDLLVRGVPPALDDAPIDERCYRSFGSIGVVERSPEETGSDLP